MRFYDKPKLVKETTELVRRVDASMREGDRGNLPKRQPVNGPVGKSDQTGEYEHEGIPIAPWKGLSEGTGRGRLMGRPIT